MTNEEKMFGSVRKLPFMGNIPVPIPKLLEPLPPKQENEEAYVIKFFCSGCGTVLPVIDSAVEQITGEAPSSYEGKFIHVERCDLCHDGFFNAEIRTIPVQ